MGKAHRSSAGRGQVDGRSMREARSGMPGHCGAMRSGNWEGLVSREPNDAKHREYGQADSDAPGDPSEVCRLLVGLRVLAWPW